MSEGLRPFRFLHVSDVLLDARLSCKDLGMSAAKRFERNGEALEAIVKLCAQAKHNRVDGLLITGNLWDADGVTALTAGVLGDAFADLGDIPVLILPGMADPYGQQSLFNAKILSVHAVRPWSDNVHIFDDAAFREWVHPKLPHVRFCARGNLGFAGERAMPAPSKVAPGMINVLADYRPFDSASDSLAAFDYVAFGGAGNYRLLAAPDGRACGAAPGTFIGRTLQELGMRCALLVELDATTHPATLRIERVPTDKRQILAVTASINGVKDVAQHLAKACADAGARPQIDMVNLTLTGMHAPGKAIDTQSISAALPYYHTHIVDQTRPDYFLDAADQLTTPGKFIRVLQELKNKAESKGSVIAAAEYGGTLTSRQIEDALYYGLEALSQKKVTVADEG